MKYYTRAYRDFKEMLGDNDFQEFLGVVAAIVLCIGVFCFVLTLLAISMMAIVGAGSSISWTIVAPLLIVPLLTTPYAYGWYETNINKRSLEDD